MTNSKKRAILLSRVGECEMWRKVIREEEGEGRREKGRGWARVRDGE